MKIFAFITGFGLLAAGVVVAWFAHGWSQEMSPESFMPWLATEPSVYANVDSIAESDLQFHAYAYETNKYADAIPGSNRLPKIADAEGFIPSFKLGDDIFVITWKWVNESAGLAISNSPDFKSRTESLDHGFRVRRLSESIYEWKLDLEAPSVDKIAD